MLLFPLFAVLAFTPLLQGLFDFPLQSAFQAIIFFSCLLWLFRIQDSRFKIQDSGFKTGAYPSPLNLQSSIFNLKSGILNFQYAGVRMAVFAVMALSFFSMFSSPVRALVWPEWGNLAAGLLIFIFSGFLSPEERKKTDLALRIAAWGTVILAVVQALVLKSPQISASLTNPNALALFVIMLLPLAASWKDWWLAGAMLVLLIWTQSAGAAIALIVAAGFYMHQSFGRAEFKKNLPIFALLAIALVLVISQVPLQSFVHRLLWWKSAMLMFLSSPFLGFGHAAFTFVYPAYRGAVPGDMGSIYAHSYYLEFLAENGIFCAALWFGLLVYAIKKKPGLAKYSLIAALSHCAIDFGLSVPANFWIFSYLAAPENRERARGSAAAQEKGREGISQERIEGFSRPALLAARQFHGTLPSPSIEAISQKGGAHLVVYAVAAVLAAAWLNLCLTHNRALRAQASAVSCYSGRDFMAAENKFQKALEIENGPLSLEALGEIESRLASEKKDRGMLFSAAVFFERALILNPYSASAYRNLAAVYRAAGEDKLLRGLEERRKRVFR